MPKQHPIVVGAMLALAAAMHSCLPTSAASATDYVVSPSGSGTSCTNAAPCSVDTALNAAGGGDHVVFLNGRYGPVASRRAGVTYRAYERHHAILDGDGSNAITISHNDSTVRGLSLTTNKKGPRVGVAVTRNASNIVIEGNHVHDTGQAGIQIGRIDWDRIDGIVVRHNLIEDTGFVGNGEGIYVGDPADLVAPGSIMTNVQVYGNMIRRATTKGIKVGGTVISADIHHNLIENQLYREQDFKENNQGTCACDGFGIMFHDNLLRNNVDARLGAFYLTEDGGSRIDYNVIINHQDETGRAIITFRDRTYGSGGPTIVENNLFCDVSTTLVEESNAIVRNNPGLDQPEVDCAEREAQILAAIERRIAPGFQWGVVEADHDWVTVPLAGDFVDPVVVAKPATANGWEPGEVRIASVTGTSFRARFQEWPYLDGDHAKERIFYMVAEAGRSNLGGLSVEAGKVETDLVLDGGWDDVAFDAPFERRPELFASVMSYNDADTVVTRTRGIGTSAFQITMQEQELDGFTHTGETLGWIAIERGLDTLPDGRRITVTSRLVDSGPQHVDLGFSADPFVLASISTAIGPNPTSLRLLDVGSSGFDIRLQEEQSLDPETDHGHERVSLFVSD